MGCDNIIKELGRPVGFIAKTEKQMETICSEIDLLNNSPESILKYQRNSIYLRFCHKDYHKGSSLQALAKHLGIETDAIFAVGDQHNDLPMLHPSIAGMLACPSNSIPEVVGAVEAGGGYVAAEAFGLGVLEAIEFFTGTGLSREFAA
jgi:hydroxymethylpyrimidine pyrophosphatase-like HAD family hydrolase